NRGVAGNRRLWSPYRQTIPLNASAKHGIALAPSSISKTSDEFVQNFLALTAQCSCAVSYFKDTKRTHYLGGGMYVSSRLTTGLVFAVVLAVALWTFGVPSVQATAAQDSCPTQTCVEKPTPPPQSCLTCPVDPKEVKRQEKAAAHAQHEAEEAQARAQKE